MPPAESPGSQPNVRDGGDASAYVPSLDGVRALAILAVVGFHAALPGFGNGRAGVDVFFVLSGYLITNILVNGRGLRAFYLGRVRRLMPAYLTMLTAVVLLGPFLLPYDGDALWDATFAALYLTDLWAPATNQKGALLHTWSLALEMQFYLAWPFVLRLRRALLIPALCVFWIALSALRFAVLTNVGAIDPVALSPMRTSGLILGAILALYPLPAKRWCIPVGVCLLIVATAVMSGTVALKAAGLTVGEIAAVLLVIGARGPWPTILSTPILVRLGVLSYGLYLWHYPLVVMARPFGDVAAVVVSLGGGLALAALSHRFIETPFRQKAWKAKREESAATA